VYKAPFRQGSFWYYFSNPNGQFNQSVLYRTEELSLPDAAAEKFFDPNQFSIEGSDFVEGYGFSPSGAKFAAVITYNETDYGFIVVQTTKSPVKVLSDVVRFARRGQTVTWDAKEEGFTYSRFIRPSYITWDIAGIDNLAYDNFQVRFWSLLSHGAPRNEDEFLLIKKLVL
jgi:hypothetical protein